MQYRSTPNIILTGFMGTGKSTIGREIARLLGREFIDTDELIQARSGMTIPEIFTKLGEAAFRQMEREVAAELACRHSMVLGTGGRFMLDVGNAAVLSPNNLVFCLTATAETILSRITGDGTAKRPLLAGDNPEQHLRALLADRKDGYGQFQQVATDNRQPEEIARQILELYSRQISSPASYIKEPNMIDGKTTLYGIIGNPVSHSLSPAMHNRAFHELGLNSVYVPFPVSDVQNGLPGLKALGVKGVSVTIPHKVAVLDFLDRVDPIAAAIGAVNTILVQEEDGRQSLFGTNTDWQGANRALEDVTAIAGKNIIILGAGGSARAIGFGLQAAKAASVTLCSRTENRGRALAGELNCLWCPLGQLSQLSGDILINATSVGMQPESDRTPAPDCDLSQFDVVMDIVYAPLETLLLRQARAAGCTTVSGLEMLLYQGVSQFELWTGQPAPVSMMRETLLHAINIM